MLDNILGDGFYEWKNIPGKKYKQPIYIHLKGSKPFAFAGLWEEWNSSDGSHPPGYYDGYLDSDAFFVFEPGMEIELNIVSFFRIAIGGSYRYTSDINLIGHDPDLLRNFNAYFTLKFGKF